ncbi:isocitrate/isopropylmalate dehydrogenase family protein [Candidatus Poriferisodalis sp.]|uniref:isocitrate/isopropylmalate dehydrogenase family protein n=1 Tax=Candidatus Poriferisodalis sp. TaxID=3101277 RepID=UPI003B52A75E
MTSDRRHKVCVIPGDDAAPEAMAASLRVLHALDLPIEWDHVPVGDELAALTPEEREALVGEHIDAADTVLFGSSNGTTPGAGFMRWGKKTYANVRPVRWRPGYASPLARPEGIDYVIVRENLEDMYVGVMGPAKLLLDAGLTDGRSRVPPDAANGRFAAKIITRPGTEQVTRFACELALQRGGKLTVSAKTNMLPATDRWFCDIAREVASEYPGLEYEQFIIDDMAHRLVVRPHDLDVLLLPNLYGDILSDEGAGTIGGMGLAPSGCYGDDWAYFESAHGTAPDIAGLGIINPTATLESAEMMLRHLRLDAPAGRLDRALAEVYEDGEHVTPDQGGVASTEDFATAVISAL